MGEAPGSIPGEGSTVVGDHPPCRGMRNRQTRSSLPCRGSAAAVAALGKPAAAGRESWALCGCGAACSASNEEGAGSIPVIRTLAPLAQLAEALDLGSRGSQFESGEGHQRAWPIVGSDVGERWG